MKKEEKGVWSWESKEELHGVYYDYLITRDGEEVRSADPYAKACGVNGLRSMAVNLKKTNPKGWEKDQTPKIISIVNIIFKKLFCRIIIFQFHFIFHCLPYPFTAPDTPSAMIKILLLLYRIYCYGM